MSLLVLFLLVFILLVSILLIYLIKLALKYLFYSFSPTPWPLNTSFCLLATTFSAVLSFQGFTKGISLLSIALINVV